MGLLADILTRKAAEAAALSASPLGERMAESPPRDVLAALRRSSGDPLRLIAEIKFRSPSAGALSRRLGAGERARAYEQGGASMVSVLTDRTWFDGSFDDLSAARAEVSVPLLCKDFVIDLAQIDRAWTAGADAVLLIVRCLRQGGLLPRLVEGARSRGLEPFVEVGDERELDLALAAGARVVGVNARDLDTLEIDAERAKRVLESIPTSTVAVHFSGLKSGPDAAAMAASRADAALIGEALMRCDDPRPLLDELARGAASGPPWRKS
ncbi:MAG TPA: indole-3-glycerol-phosphate synthase [Polyangiaceae bacterium]|jgi:indole-3-glycerol phosphate synthase|nr:indole-3-glycerol-phosphate synthase [Polyangiaceae bacterium]